MTRKLKEFVNHDAAIPNANCAEAMGEEHVCILLALKDGAATLGEQLESIARQSHRDWSLIVSDDGSRDDWLPVVSDFNDRLSKTNRSWIVGGPHKGFARNFLSLACHAGPLVPFVAFCDQDDVWLEHKLARALAHLGSAPPGVPAIYVSRTMIGDAKLQNLRPSRAFKRPPGFENALVQSIGGGNTMVLNRKALDLLQDSARHAKSIVSHDWWAYQLISGAGGKVFYDQTPTVLYRQHGGNQIGANDTYLASLSRVCRVFQGQFRRWNSDNMAALDRSRHWLTEEARATLDGFAASRKSNVFVRLSSVYRLGIRRQTLRGTFALWLAAIFNKL